MSDERTGRGLDAAVAEKVSGWTGCENDGVSTTGRPPAGAEDHDKFSGIRGVYHVPHYSRDWAGAGLVIEEMRRKGWAVRVNDVGAYGWDVTFNGHGRSVFGNAPEIGVAVCRAALNAVEGTT